MNRFLYLHGLASGPYSQKATAFRKKFDSLQLELEIPDLENGNFKNLTLSGQMTIIETYLERFPDDSWGVIGSSMGGYLAALASDSREEIKAIYLIAPAFEFLRRWEEKVIRNYGEGAMPALIHLFHYRKKKICPLSTKIFDDAKKWDRISFQRTIPTRIIHGVHDESVGIEVSRKFASGRMACRLTELDSDHGLISHIDWIVEDSLKFFRSVGLM